jgi:hypothetical protein
MQAPAAPLMSAAQASQLLDHVVHQRVRELIDFCCLLAFEQELSHALSDCGLARDEVPEVSAQMIARALTRIGEEHVKLASDPAFKSPTTDRGVVERPD